MSNETFASGKLSALEEAQQKAEDAAAVIQARYPGSFTKWINTQTLRVFSRFNQPVATIHLETLQ